MGFLWGLSVGAEPRLIARPSALSNSKVYAAAIYLPLKAFELGWGVPLHRQSPQ